MIQIDLIPEEPKTRSGLEEILEEALRLVRRGEVAAVSLILTPAEEGPPRFNTAWRLDLPRPYECILSGATEYQQRLLEEGL